MSFEINGGDATAIMSLLGVIFTGLLGYLTAKLTARAQEKKDKPVTESTVVETMKKIMEEDREVSKRRIEQEHSERKAERADLEKRISALEKIENDRARYDTWLGGRITDLYEWADREGKAIPPPPLVGYEQWRSQNSQNTA